MSIRKRAIVILTMFAFFYALLELGMNWDPSQCLNSPAWMRNLFNSTISIYFYRVIYDGLFLSIVYSITGKLISWETLWYFIYASTVEDIFYWVIGVGLSLRFHDSTSRPHSPYFPPHAVYGSGS